MISDHLIRTTKFVLIGLFIFCLSVSGFVNCETATKFLFMISGLFGLANIIYALIPKKSSVSVSR